MWESEAKWIASQVNEIRFNDALSTISCLNLGSSTLEYRISKPYIELLMESISRRGVTITHVDGKQGEGIDISGDFCDKQFRLNLSKRKYDLILCNNVLTHVQSASCVYEIINGCLAEGGYVIVSAPNIYPYCADPYDSKYRPSAEEIARNLPRFRVEKWTEIESTETHLTRLVQNPRQLFSFLHNICVPLRGIKRLKNVFSDVFNINKKFRIVCVVMKYPHNCN
ncbi:MAG: methyltransferase domain-containing protein [Cellvibrio sp.]|uniref:class I SAM-dependent methyltransferase n=1 Tax=Cellvibrio sp. TaxID=1965322 RepID=UPI002717206B|nr:methyltransferase domain-containing protein [Cellvibrio sp.]